MSFVRVCSVPLAIVLAVVSLACAGDPPENEIREAERALDGARAAGAPRYAADELEAAEDALKRAHAAVGDRDYRLALNDALDSRDRARNAARLAASAKSNERVDADRALSAAGEALSAAQTRMKNAARSRASARTLGNARTAVSHAETRLQEARSAFDKGDYLAASAEAVAVTNLLTVATSELGSTTAGGARRSR